MTTTENMEKLNQNINDLTVLILAAGYGRRMGPFSRMVNKGLIPYKNKPLISHIIDKFDKGTKFVIACGHLGQQIKDYVGTVHSDKNIVFVDIPDYSEGNTGPATTIQHCRDHLTGGFLWLACDTLFDFDFKSRLDHNWIGVYPVDSSLAKDYCWIERDGDHITRIENKVTNKKAVDAFIGLMYAKDGQYLENLQKVKAKETYQGFLENLDLKAHTVKQWFDFGTYEKWQELNSVLPEESFTKPNELFYHDNNKIIKYFVNPDHVTARFNRAQQNPRCMPTNMLVKGNFLIHDYAQGDIIYNQVSAEIFKRMLAWCETNLWIKPSMVGDYYHACHKFYHTKTMERVEQFRIKYPDWEEPYTVNQIPVSSIDSYLRKIDWSWLCKTVEWCFIHGDLHFDNTIYDSANSKFTAIDWRTDFAGFTNGDLYYDLAKLLGGLRLNYRAIKHNNYSYVEKNETAEISIPSVHGLEDFEHILQSWVEENNLNWRKVQILVPLIYLNMSPLHEAPFDKFLIALAQYYFAQVL